MRAHLHPKRAVSWICVGVVLLLPLLLLSLGCSSTGAGPVNYYTTTQSSETALTTEEPVVTTSTVPASTTTEPTAADFNVDDIKADYVYTSELITILYPLYGSKLDDFVIVTLSNKGSQPAKVVVESEIPGYTNQAIDTVNLGAGQTLEVRQNPLLIPDVINDLNVEKPAEVHIRVAALQEGVEKTILEETGETTIYARRDFPLSIEGFTEAEGQEFFAAMVTPNDPSVEELIRKAANYADGGVMTSGYGGHVNDDDGAVWDRLQAIWQAENEYDLTYISTWVSFAPGSVQRIRLPAEVLDQHSGNCIELAMLYASAVEALDMEAALILIPGHAYVAIREDLQNADYYVVETTMIGHSTFSEAVDMGSSEFNDAMPHLTAGESGYGWVKIWDAREHGILPVPWR
jgi:hypothetical protein